MHRNSFIIIVVAIAFFIAGSMATLAYQSLTEDNTDTNTAQNQEQASTRVVSGTITRVDTDCAQARYLNEAGEVVEEGAAVCDAGSFVTIDDTRIHTASGFVPADQSFNRHNTNWQPGEELSLRAAETEFDYLTLDCEDCGVVEQ